MVFPRNQYVSPVSVAPSTDPENSDSDIGIHAPLAYFQYILREKIRPHIKNGSITKEQALSAMEECWCGSIGQDRDQDAYDRCLSRKLNIDIES